MTSVRPNSYALLLPRGWRQVPVGSGSEAAVDDLLEEAFAGLPNDSVGPWRRRARAQLLAQLEQAKAASALDLYLPFEPLHGRPAAASFVVAHFTAADGDANAEILTRLRADPDAGTVSDVTVGGQPALRSTYVAPAEPAQLEEMSPHDVRHVDYYVPVPGGGMLVVAFSTVVLHAGDNPTPPEADDVRFDELLVELFDAIVSTLRWRAS